MRSERGITLVALATTVILILILATITTYYGISSYIYVKRESYIAELKAVQERVNSIMADYENYKDEFKEMNDYIDSLNFNKLSTGETFLKEFIEARGDELNDYYFFTPEEIENKLGLKRNEGDRH